jgi:HlyD family secretion protein
MNHKTGAEAMKIRKIFIALLLLAATTYAMYFGYVRIFRAKIPSLFSIKKVQKRNIRHIITASGSLEIKQVMKIGSLVAGTVKQVHIQENQRVKQGDLLVEIDIGKGDTDFKAALYRFKKAQVEYEYQKKYHARQAELFKLGQIAQDNFQRITKDYQKSLHDMQMEKALMEKARMELDNSKIHAPEEAIVTAVNVSKGMAVLNDFQNILLEMAHDITEMEAILDIDESDIGHIKAGQKVTITVNTYPDMIFKGTIQTVNFTPKANGHNGRAGSDSTPFYKATVEVVNKQNLLRPGMAVNAKIHVDKASNTVSIPGVAFQVNPKTVQKVAKRLNYEFQPITSKNKRRLLKASDNKRTKFVWVVDKKSFVEKAINVGITDDNYWEIKDGLTLASNLVIDVEEPDNMDKLYKEWFRKF